MRVELNPSPSYGRGAGGEGSLNPSPLGEGGPEGRVRVELNPSPSYGRGAGGEGSLNPSPLGEGGSKGRVRVSALIIDPAVAAMTEAITGANKTDHHIRHVVPGRDFPLAGENIFVSDIRLAAQGDTHNGRLLKFERGIEIGRICRFDESFAQNHEAHFLDEIGRQRRPLLFSLSLDMERILAAIIEMHHDDGGCILPPAVAPFVVEIIAINMDVEAVAAAANSLEGQLSAAGVEVLLDDRPARAGVKFKDADLIGIPIRIVVGEKNAAVGKVEIRRRTENESRLLDFEAAAKNL